jgi:hypothetical protein
MNDLIPSANNNPETALDPEIAEGIAIVIRSRVEDPQAAKAIVRAVLLTLNKSDLRLIRHRDKYLATIIDRAILERLQLHARATATGETFDMKADQGFFTEPKMVLRWLSCLSIVLSGAVGTFVWTWRLLNPIRHQFQDLFLGSSSLEFLLIGVVSTAAVLIGGALGLLAARHGAGK